MKTGFLAFGTIVLILKGPSLKAQGVITGTVLGDDNRPVEAVSVSAIRAERTVARESSTDARGVFRLGDLAPGVYTVTARKVGYRSAELPGVRLALGQTLNVNVTLTQAPRQLSTINVVVSPASVDASTPELTIRLDRVYTELLPSARTASSLIALVPGARKDQLWGGAPGVSNNYQLDGVAVNHPGIGGDFLALSVDWIETVDVRGLGAGAEHGNFQGGIINAITKTGSNDRRYALRTNYESPGLTATNFNLGEEGVEQAGRREIGGEVLGPVARDRLFYFAAAQYVDRDLRAPDLAIPGSLSFQRFHEQQTDVRGIAKLTWLPALGHRVELLGGFSSLAIEHAGINGVDDPGGLHKVRRPTSYHGLSWMHTPSARNQVELRFAGFNASESRTGYQGVTIPGVRVIQAGRQGRYQNAEFRELREPRSLTATLTWRTKLRALTEHDLVVGAEGTRGWWRDERTRNGRLTWRPYPPDSATMPFDPNNAATWQTVASEWGGEMRLNSDVGSEAVFVQDRFALGRLTFAPGLRYGHWSGYVRPYCDPPGGRVGCHRFEAVRATAFDPRIGVTWDITGRSTFAAKAHFGRYHQGMFALFYDRVDGANVYSNLVFYQTSPPLTSSRQTFTPEQRDAPTSGFSRFPIPSLLDASGRVENYRQPYVDQSVLSLEKSFGARWKAEVVYTNRRNGDIVGLVDRNMFTNYTLISNVSVEHRYVRGAVLDADGNRLVIPFVYASNKDIQDYMAALAFRRQLRDTLFGYPTSYLRTLKWNPEVVLTSVDDARRRYDQVTVLVRTVQPMWRVDASLTGAQLRGNVPGVTGYGTTATRFSAGPFVNPNESFNMHGHLPDALQLEGKVWLTARLPHALHGGLLYTHTLGERFTPSFPLEGRYVYRYRETTPIGDEVFRQSFGQSILLEPRGSRNYASRAVVDAHLEWRSPRRAVLTLDLFNAFAENEAVSVKTTVEDQFAADPTTRFGAVRMRVAPRTLRIGFRLE